LPDTFRRSVFAFDSRSRRFCNPPVTPTKVRNFFVERLSETLNSNDPLIDLVRETVAGQEKTSFRGRDRVAWAFTFAAAAYNLVRLPKLIAETGRWPRCPASQRPVRAAGASSKWTTGTALPRSCRRDASHLDSKSDGEVAFGALKGFLGVRYGDGSPCAEFMGRARRE
jgi:hypothetical protein